MGAESVAPEWVSASFLALVRAGDFTHQRPRVRLAAVKTTALSVCTLITGHDHCMDNRVAAGDGTWWTVLPDSRGRQSTYSPKATDQLPPLPNHLIRSTAWLASLPDVPEDVSITRTDQAERPLTPSVSGWMVNQGIPKSVIPGSLSTFIEKPSLLDGIRSVTMCFLDLGNRVVNLDSDAGGGWLVHFMSDQQGAIEWLVRIFPTGHHHVVATPALIGYDIPSEPDEPYPVPDGTLRLEDLASLKVRGCAPSLDHFLVRFWLENEVWWVNHGEPSTRKEVDEYRDAWLRSIA